MQCVALKTSSHRWSAQVTIAPTLAQVGTAAQCLNPRCGNATHAALFRRERTRVVSPGGREARACEVSPSDISPLLLRSSIPRPLPGSYQSLRKVQSGLLVPFGRPPFANLETRHGTNA